MTKNKNYYTQDISSDTSNMTEVKVGSCDILIKHNNEQSSSIGGCVKNSGCDGQIKSSTQIRIEDACGDGIPGGGNNPVRSPEIMWILCCMEHIQPK